MVTDKQALGVFLKRLNFVCFDSVNHEILETRLIRLHVSGVHPCSMVSGRFGGGQPRDRARVQQ